MNKPVVAQKYKILIDALAKRFGDKLKLVVLFGSQSRGEARPDSDHDLFLVIDDLPRDPLARHRAVMMVLLPHLLALPAGISLIAKTPEEISGDFTPLLIDVCMDGICLFGHSLFAELQEEISSALDHSALSRTRVAGTWMWIAPTHSPGTWQMNREAAPERV